ncbi:MAG: preprotein translocase subunit SecG [Ferruginibacter sp.]
MLILFGVLVIIASIVLGLIVLVQNPKGGGLSGSLGGFSNQLMGVKQTTDVLEKGTWIFAAIVGGLCIISPLFIPKNAEASSKNEELINKTPSTAPNTQTTVPLPKSVQPTDTTKK